MISRLFEKETSSGSFRENKLVLCLSFLHVEPELHSLLMRVNKGRVTPTSLIHLFQPSQNVTVKPNEQQLWLQFVTEEHWFSQVLTSPTSCWINPCFVEVVWKLFMTELIQCLIILTPLSISVFLN